MELRDSEKLIIYMLCRIWKKLDLGEDVETNLIEEAIQSGNYWAIKEGHPVIFHDTNNSQFRSEVGDILSMWERLEQDFEALSPDEKALVHDGGHPSVRFEGFDGNNETEHMSVAKFLIEDMGYFEHFKGRGLNAHKQTLGRHRRMLEKWHALLSGGLFAPMTEKQIIEVVDLRR